MELGKALKTGAMCVMSTAFTLGMAIAPQQANAQAIPSFEQAAKVHPDTETYNIKNIVIRYNRGTGDVSDLIIEAWKRPPEGDTDAGLTTVQMRLSTDRDRAIDPRRNNNALFIKNAESLSDPYTAGNGPVFANIDLSIKPSGYARMQDNAFVVIPEPGMQQNDMFNSAYTLKEMAFTGDHVPLRFEDQLGRPYDTPQRNLNALKSDASVYGLLINNFQMIRTKQFDREANNRQSRYRETVRPYIPGM